MIRQSKARIFLAEERGHHESAWFISKTTGSIFNERKEPFGPIDVVNDDILDGDCSVKIIIKKNSWIFFLPVMGALKYKDTKGNETLIAAGQGQLVKVEKKDIIELSNPFKEGLVNFLQVWIRADQADSQQTPLAPLIREYDVNAHLNKLVRISPEKFHGAAVPFNLSIGKFTGRGETTHTLSNKKASVFTFVIEGAFETEGRLLHARDGLALWEVESVEMEALSNDAIVLLVESPL